MFETTETCMTSIDNQTRKMASFYNNEIQATIQVLVYLSKVLSLTLIMFIEISYKCNVNRPLVLICLTKCRISAMSTDR